MFPGAENVTTDMLIAVLSTDDDEMQSWLSTLSDIVWLPTYANTSRRH